jgi:hypothetical protein
MKKLLLPLLGLLAMSSCTARKNLLTETEIKNWKVVNDTLLYKNTPAAVFTHYEIELYRGKIDRELCLEQLNDTIVSIDNIIYYVHTIHHNDKVQVISTYKREK